MFQSPSHRGGSAPAPCKLPRQPTSHCFNPLLIGAGALPLRRLRTQRADDPPVSIPFSSGRERSRGDVFFHQPPVERFNPLLIGAGALPFTLTLSLSPVPL